MKKILLFLVLPITIFAQTTEISSINVDATSVISVVADVIYFSISIGVEKEDPQIAFNEHKMLEKKFLQLIKNYEVSDTSIQFSLLSIRKTRKGKENKLYFKTSQSVKITFTGILKYHSVQIDLLKNGFYEFRSGFSSTHIKEAREKGYQSALDLAKRDAEMIARSLNRKLGPIIKVSTKSREFVQFSHAGELRVPSVQSLIEIDQSVSSRTNLNVEFKLD